MNKLAFVAFAAALALVPAVSSAALDSNPKPVPGGGVPPGQTQYLNTVTTINFTVTPACTALSSPDTINFSAQPTTNNPTAQANFPVNWNCGNGIQPHVTFLSTGSAPCKLVNGSYQIPYQIFATGTSGQNLCNATDQGIGNNAQYAAPAGESGNNGHNFNIVTGQLVDGNGQALYPPQTYSDTVNVYLNF